MDPRVKRGDDEHWGGGESRPAAAARLESQGGQFACRSRRLKDARSDATGQGPVLDTPGPAGSHPPWDL